MPVQNRIFRHLPNFITSLNMLCGCIGAIYAFNNDLISASILILIAAIFDFLDGMAARLFNAYSDVGKELDSLADIISFGFTPSVILFQLLKRSLNIESFSFDLPIIELAGLILPFLIVVFSGLRLAKFNIDKSQTNSFIGLPTPASALFIISLPFILEAENTKIFHAIILNKYFLVALIIILCLLLVAKFPMFAMKFKNFKFRDNRLRFVFTAISIILLVLLKFAAIPLIIIIYIILSAINNWIVKL